MTALRSTSIYRRLIIGTVLLFGIGLLLLVLLGPRSRTGEIRISARGPGIGVVEIRGTLMNAESIVEQIEALAARREVLALLVRLESPGGGVVASDQIYRALLRVRDEEEKPVVAWLGSIAASGAYYIACAADTIVAHPSSTTGSIGVIVEFPIATELMHKLGVEWESIASGPYKSMGSPFRPVSESQRQWFGEVIRDNYEQFLEVVRERRGLEESVLESYADGRVFTGRQAVRWGFADRLGDWRDARRLAGRMSGLGEDPRLIKVQRRARITLWDLVFGRAGPAELAVHLGVGPLDAPHVYYIIR